MGYYVHMLMISSLGNETFFSKVINLVKHVFTMGLKHCAAFKHLGLNISQSNFEIILDQVNYINTVDVNAISNDRKKQKDDLLCKEENDSIRALVGQLGWITGQNRPNWEYAN